MLLDDDLDLCKGLADTMISESWWRADGDFRVTAESSANMTLHAIQNYIKWTIPLDNTSN